MTIIPETSATSGIQYERVMPYGSLGVFPPTLATLATKCELGFRKVIDSVKVTLLP